MAFAIGSTVYWTSGGEVYSGTVFATPTQHSTGVPNQDGGESFYRVNSVSPSGGSVTSTTVIPVRTAELRASA